MTPAGTVPPVEHPVLKVRGRNGASAGSGWSTPDHHANRLRSVLGGKIENGHGFGGPWPVVAFGDRSLAGPGLPVVVGPHAVDGPDASYDHDDHTVWRETAVGRHPVVQMRKSAAERETAAERDACTELLWFGDTTRWRVRGRLLEAEDAFSRVSVSATAARLEDVLVRRRRVEEEVLHGVEVAPAEAGIARVEVWRDGRLVPDAVTRSATHLLISRPEISSLEERGARLEGVGADGAPLELAVTYHTDGWTVERLSGMLPFSSLILELGADRVRLAAEVDPAVDCLAPGVRQRLVFDLYSDLVAAGRGADQKS